MTQPDYRGARGATAGDDFHELWTLRQALTLLDQDTRLTAITVEGLRAEDERGTPQDTWDGVDCTFYFGGDDAVSAKRIVIDQLKYSAANRDKTWTVARLTSSTNKKQDNSVVGRLAKAFTGISAKRPDLIASGDLVIRLVSNQQVDPAIISTLSGQNLSDQSVRVDLQKASGLQDSDFETFMRILDLSECGQGSRFALEERIFTTISEWTDDDARAAVNDLMRFVRRAMMPEAKGEFITRQSILAQLGFSDPRALFPCPSAIKIVERLIPRETSRIVTERMLNGDQRICLHGEGGCGKTTALQEITAMLPLGSVVVIYDCYGGGRYLDSDAYRHRPQDAFLQFSNDLARQLRIPLLVNRSADIDYPKVFKKRLERVAEVVASRGRDALLVMVVDAADNSITAASTLSPPERSFVHDFVSLGDLPTNVRFVVTARTGRLFSLNLARGFTQLSITGFARNETAAHVRGIWNNAPDSWIEDFHHLSLGNPRVQRYSLEYAGSEPVRALDYLRPHGKALDQVFYEQLEHARHKVGRDQDIKIFCSGLVALPRPIPIVDLSAVTDLSEAHIRDLCADLAPGIRLMTGSISFADEDFEHFIRIEAEEKLDSIRERIAAHFVSRHKSDAYAATHIATALLVAGRWREIIDLVNGEREPTAIGDPVLRREAQLQRLRIAMKVCRETGNNVDAILTLLIGAEALKTDAAIRQMLIENPDLAANFARDTSSRIFLRDSNQVEHHGPLLFHFMATDARNGDGISVREGHRQIHAWMQRRTANNDEQKAKHPNASPQEWSISHYDIAAATEAVLRIAGPRHAVNYLLRWRPRSIALRVASILAFKLITSGDAALVERCLTEAKITTPWNLFLLTPLALAGKEVNLSRIESSLSSLLRRGLIRVDRMHDNRNDNNAAAKRLDMILTACELIIGRGGDRERVVPVLERIADREVRRRDRLFPSQISLIDFSLRAHAIIERLAGRKATLETFLVEPPDSPEDLPSNEAERRKRVNVENKKELQDFVEPLIDLYDVRAQALLGMIKPEEVNTHLRDAIARFHNNDYQFFRKHQASVMRTRVALSITRLMALPNLNHAILFEHACSVMDYRSDPLGSAEAEILESLALDRSLHHQILSAITIRANTVRSMRISADDKITALVRFARLLVPISYADAESLFNEAIAVSGEVNIEAIHEIALFAPLVKHSVTCMDFRTRREVARNLGIVVEDAGVRLAGHDGFPWDAAAKALATLDVSFALAATARWDDANVVDYHSFLPPIIETALADQEVSPTHVTALTTLLNKFGSELSSRVIETAKKQHGLSLKALAEELAKDELLRFGSGTRPEICDKLKSLQMDDGPNYWIDQLVCATAFHRTVRQDVEERRHDGQNGSDKNRADPLANIDWTAHRYVSTNEIADVIDLAFVAVRATDRYISFIDVLDRIRDVVTLGDRVAHLEALTRSKSPQIPDYELVQAITKCINAWRGTPSVDHWCRERLLQIVLEQLPGFSRWLVLGDFPLPALLKNSGATDDQICAALLAAMERHVDILNVSTVYALVELVGQYCSPLEAAQVVTRYVERLVQRIPPTDRENWELSDIPINVDGGVARFLYALMGDVDVRIRWRAAHAVRRLARLRDIGTLDQLVGLYNRTSERSYRAPDAPFYWLAARHWLVMTLDRIAAEAPLTIGHHGRRLLEIAKNEEFPHVIIRSFAKSAVSKLIESGNLKLDTIQRSALKRANTSPVRRKKVREPYSVGFDRYRYKERDDRRFQFDSMDTLHSWYTEALRAFADVNGEEFLDSAERWIVDHWGVQNNPWRWDDEPRKDRFSDRAHLLMDHRDGSRPIIERYSTYLEWHAMWCTTGELMPTHALAKTEEDGYYNYEEWLKRNGLAAPPLWLADLRSIKPLEHRLWFSPQGDIDVWVDEVDDEDFISELGLDSGDGTVVVSSSHSTRSRNFMLSARVQTALVSPDTAAALVRALQTVNSSWDYKIPPAGDSLEIETATYKLLGWLVNGDHDSGIVERDPLRYEVGTIACRPSNKVMTALNLEFVHDNQARWVDTKRRKTVFVYDAWGDNRGDEHEDSLRYDGNIHSSGWRLRIDKETLKNLLNKIGFDLIVEIEITRRNKGYESYSRYDEEKTKEAHFDKVVLFRRDGTIEAAEGRLGTWTASRA